MGAPKGKGTGKAPTKGGKADGKGKSKSDGDAKGKGKGKYDAGEKGKGKGKYPEGGKNGGKGKKPDADESPAAKERPPHEYALDARPYWGALQELFKNSSVRPNDFDPKAVQLLDALQEAGKDKELIAHLEKSLEGVTRDKVQKMRAYVFKLMREFDKDVYNAMKDSRGWPRPRRKEVPTTPSGQASMSLAAPEFVPGKAWKAPAPEFVPGQLWPGIGAQPMYQVPPVALINPWMAQPQMQMPTVVPAAPANAPVVATMPAEAARPPAALAAQAAPATEVTFSVECKTEVGENVVIVGSIADLGSWDVKRAKKLETGPEAFPVWKTAALQIACNVEYKFVILKGDEVRWEPIVGNRVFKQGTEVKLAKFGEL